MLVVSAWIGFVVVMLQLWVSPAGFVGRFWKASLSKHLITIQIALNFAACAVH